MGNLIGKGSLGRLGRVGLLLVLIAGKSWAFPVTVAESPGSNLNLTVKAISSAKKSLLINIYEFTSHEVKDAILDRINAGVAVTILEEGQPVGGLSKDAKAIRAEIAKAMSQHKGHFYTMDSQHTVTRRYRFDHAKYTVIDGKTLLVGSENYAPGGQPRDGAIGNRGWEILLQSPQLAKDFSEMFAKDSDPSNGDIVSGVAEDGADEGEGDDDGGDALDRARHALSSWITNPQLGIMMGLLPNGTGNPDENFPLRAPDDLEAETAEKVASPESSLLGLGTLIEGAKTSLDLELMTFALKWGNTGKKSPLFEAVVKAARRGVKVRVLLNDEHAFSAGAKQNNLLTANALNDIARKENLKLHGEVAKLKAMGVKIIHNKGVLVDGDKTLISSINWNQNSVENNRETAVVVKSPAVYQHYFKLFEADWQASQ